MKFITLTNIDDSRMILVNLAQVQSVWPHQYLVNGKIGATLHMTGGDRLYVREPMETFITLIRRDGMGM